MAEYVHVPVGEEIRSIAGYYKVLEEGVLEYRGREVLYLLKMAVVETSCCGEGGLGFISVPGYLISYRSGRNAQGAWVSRVERVSGEDEQREIAEMLKGRHPHFHQVAFS
ncbi:MAG: hypothetical protein N2Z74_05620 [Syntrophales bacterium]|nr:hypothetical protein [Syntrophales bacterium]